MIKKIVCIALLGLLFAKPLSVFAWGGDGHTITAQIAYNLLPPQIQDSIKYYLGDMSMAEAGNWMDNIRSNSAYDSLKPLHYINIEKGKQYNPDSVENIIGELHIAMQRLKDRSHYTKEQTAMNIKIVMHLIGDLHQPLHCGYGKDQGGNLITVKFIGWISNLHKVWDSEMITQDNVTYKDCMKVAQKLLKQQGDKLTQGDIISWMNESRTYLPQVYTFKPPLIDVPYMLANVDLVEKQLATGGIRLSYVLKNVFK